MRIDLKPPFNLLWKQGYLQVHKNGRKYICLFNSRFDRTIISNARYVMSVYIGQLVPEEFEVDHKDDDKTNDDIANLQIVTEEYNRLKEHYRYIMYEQDVFGFHCAWCETPFLLTERDVKHRQKYSKSGLAFCCKECSIFYQQQTECLDHDIVYQIRQLREQGLSGYKISERLKISRTTVMKYW